jgi:hypothetical protein
LDSIGELDKETVRESNFRERERKRERDRKKKESQKEIMFIPLQF